MLCQSNSNETSIMPKTDTRLILECRQARPHILQRIEAYSQNEIRFNLMGLVSSVT